LRPRPSHCPTRSSDTARDLDLRARAPSTQSRRRRSHAYACSSSDAFFHLSSIDQPISVRRTESPNCPRLHSGDRPVVAELARTACISCEVMSDALQPCGKDHVANVTNDPARRRIVEYSVVNKAFSQTPWSCPSPHRPRQIPMRHVDMKVSVAADLEQHHVTVVRKWSVSRESSYGRLQRLNVCLPAASEKRVLRGDRPRSSTTIVYKPSRRQLGVDPSDVRMSTHVALLRARSAVPDASATRGSLDGGGQSLLTPCQCLQYMPPPIPPGDIAAC
jgi:hypothetical protein